MIIKIEHTEKWAYLKKDDSGPGGWITLRSNFTISKYHSIIPEKIWKITELSKDEEEKFIVGLI
jgi:hypothetical protein